MSERENGHLPLAKRTVRNKICADIWEQIKTGYAAGINLREIARKMNIPEGTVLAHAKRHGWTQQIQVATRELSVMQSDAITPVQSVPQSIASILSERKDRTKLGLSKYAAEAAEQAAEHRDKLEIAGKVKDVASVHSTLWPEESGNKQILNIGILTGEIPVYDAKTGLDIKGKSFAENMAAGRDSLDNWDGTPPGLAQRAKAKVIELPSPVINVASEVTPTPLEHQGNGAQPAAVAVTYRPEEERWKERCRHWRSYQ